MDNREVVEHLTSELDGVVVLEAQGDAFLIYDPDGDLPPERQLPFATVVTGDRYDSASDLDRPGVFRLNLGLSKPAYTARFATTAGADHASSASGGGVDYTAVDVLMPHPVYAPQHWICVLNPSRETLEAARPLIADAYGFAVRKYRNRR